MALWDDVKKNMVEWYGVAADKTNELAKVGVRRYDIFGISREIERQFGEMGSLVYDALNEGRTDIADDPALQGMAERVRALEAELKAKEEEIETIRRRDEAAAAAGAAEPGEDLGEDLGEEIEVEVYEAAVEPDPEAEIVDSEPVVEADPQDEEEDADKNG